MNRVGNFYSGGLTFDEMEAELNRMSERVCDLEKENQRITRNLMSADNLLRSLESENQSLTFDGVKQRIYKHYQSQYRQMLSKESRQIKTPTTEQHEEIIQLRGYLKGLKKASAILSLAQEDLELPLDYLGDPAWDKK